MRRVTIGAMLVLLVAAGAQPLAQAQSPLAHIKDLYSNAAYEDVLSAVAADGTDSPEIGQYKAFSLIALGRPGDAETAVEAVLNAHPGFQPDSDASPRLQELFTTVRRRLAPELLKAKYVSGKDCFDRKDRGCAIGIFTDVLSIAAHPDLNADKTVAELALLSRGFLDLSKALPAAVAAAPAETSRASEPASRPVNTGPAPSITTTPAVVVREVLPPWMPPASLARAEFRGKIRVHIGVDGKVEQSEIVTPVHPLYDETLLRASKAWTYKPGLSNGTPVPTERTVEVVLKPRLAELRQ